MKVFTHAVARAYRNRWTGPLIAFDLLGAALVGLHSRSASLGPLLIWFGCAPIVRFVYLERLHGRTRTLWRTASRKAYVITAWLGLSGVLLAAVIAVLLEALQRLPDVLGFCARAAGFAGIVGATLVLAAVVLAVVAAAFIWAGLLTMAYARAVVAPADGIYDALWQGATCLWRSAGLVVGVTGFQGLLVFIALGGQLLRPSGLSFMPLAWPAACFAPVALAILLVLSESRSCAPTRASRAHLQGQAA